MHVIALTIVDQLKNIYLLVERELKHRTSASPIGIFSAIIEPLAILLILTAVFTYIRFRVPQLGDYVLLFFASGYLPLHCFKAGASSSYAAFMQNRELLFLRRLVPFDLFLAGGVVMLGIMSTLMAFIILTFILFYEVPPPENIALMAAAFMMNNAMGVSIGSLNTLIATRFPYYITIFGIATTPLMLLSGIFYTAETLPPGTLKYMKWNPFFQSTELFREGLYHEYTSPIFSWTFYGGTMLVFLCIGLMAERFGRKALMRQAYFKGPDPRRRR